MNEIFRPCSCCKGKGRLKLSPPYQKTYDAIVRLGSPDHGEIFKALKEKIDISTVDKRLAFLIQWGLVKATGKPRWKKYSAT